MVSANITEYLNVEVTVSGVSGRVGSLVPQAGGADREVKGGTDHRHWYSFHSQTRVVESCVTSRRKLHVYI